MNSVPPVTTTVVNWPLVEKMYSEIVTNAITVEVTVRVPPEISARAYPSTARNRTKELTFVIIDVMLKRSVEDLKRK